MKILVESEIRVDGPRHTILRFIQSRGVATVHELVRFYAPAPGDHRDITDKRAQNWARVNLSYLKARGFLESRRVDWPPRDQTRHGAYVEWVLTNAGQSVLSRLNSAAAEHAEAS